MELRQLKYFVVVAEELNYRRAAKRLFISQPPLSRQIRSLEDELGVELFHRKKKRITLTKSGEFFLIEAQEILAKSEFASNKVRDIGLGYDGHIAIGFNVSGITKDILSAIKQYNKDFPGVKVGLHESGGADRIFNDLKLKHVDIAITYGGTSDPDIESYILKKEEIIYAIPSSYPQAKQELIEIKMMEDVDFIFFPRSLDSPRYDFFQDYCNRHGFQPRITHYSQPMTNRLGLVSLGIGVTYVVDSLKKTKKKGVTFIPAVEKEKEYLPVMISIRKGEKDSPEFAFLKSIGVDPTNAKIKD